MRSLYLHHNLISRIENLGHMTYLDTLNLSYNGLTRLDNLRSLPNLRTLDVSHNHLQTSDDVCELSGCATLSVVDLSHNHIDDPLVLEVVCEMPDLRVLYLFGNDVKQSICPYRKLFVSRCKQLTYLDDRPVFERERACTEAWVIGGVQLEMATRQRLIDEEHKRMNDSVTALIKMRDEKRKLSQQVSIEASSLDKSTTVSNTTEIEVVNLTERVKQDSHSDADSRSNSSANSSSESEGENDDEDDKRPATRGEIKLPWEQNKSVGRKPVLIEELGDVGMDLDNEEVPPLESDNDIINELKPNNNAKIQVEEIDKYVLLSNAPTTGETKNAACKSKLANEVNVLEDPIVLQNNEEMQTERMLDSDLSRNTPTSSEIRSATCQSEPENEANVDSIVLQNNEESHTDGMFTPESSIYVPTADEIRSASCILVDEICESAVKFCIEKHTKLAILQPSESESSDTESCASTTQSANEAAFQPKSALPESLLSQAVWKYFSEQTPEVMSTDATEQDSGSDCNAARQVFELNKEISQDNMSRTSSVPCQSTKNELITCGEYSKPHHIEYAFKECENSDPLEEEIARGKIYDVIIDDNSESIDKRESPLNTLLKIDKFVVTGRSINKQICDNDQPNISMENKGEVSYLDGNDVLNSELDTTNNVVEQIAREGDLTSRLAKEIRDEESSDSEAENNLKELIKQAIFPDMKYHTQESDNFKLKVPELYTSNTLRGLGKDSTERGEVERTRPRWDCDERVLSSSEDEFYDDIKSFEDFLARTNEVLCELGITEASLQETTEEITGTSPMMNQPSAIENTSESRPSDTDLEGTLLREPQDSAIRHTDHQSPSDVREMPLECSADTSNGHEGDTGEAVCVKAGDPETESKDDVFIENKYANESLPQKMTQETEDSGVTDQSPSDVREMPLECSADTSNGHEGDTGETVCVKAGDPETESKDDVFKESKYANESLPQKITQEIEDADGAKQDSTGSNTKHQDVIEGNGRYFTEPSNYAFPETNNDEKAAEETQVFEGNSSSGSVQESTKIINDNDCTESVSPTSSKVDAKWPTSGSQMVRGDIFLDTTLESGDFKRVTDDESVEIGVVDDADSTKVMSSSSADSKNTANESERSLFLKTVQEDNVD